MNDRIGRVNKPVIFIARQSEVRQRQISTEDPDPRLHILKEAREFQMQLKTLPQAELRFLQILRAHEYVQSYAVTFQQIGGDVRAYVSGSPGYEYRHVAPFVPVLRVSSPAVGSCKLRGARASSGRPSIKGYVQRRSAGI